MKRHRRCAARLAGRLITWLGCAAVGLLLIPAGILLVLISAVRSAADRAVSWLDRLAREAQE